MSIRAGYLQGVVHEGINENVENRRSAVDKLTQIKISDEIAYYGYGKEKLFVMKKRYGEWLKL
jgi:hypothetical protein